MGVGVERCLDGMVQLFMLVGISASGIGTGILMVWICVLVADIGVSMFISMSLVPKGPLHVVVRIGAESHAMVSGSSIKVPGKEEI